MIETRAIGFNIKFETILESMSEITRALASKSAAPVAPPVEDEPELDVVEGTNAVLVTNLKDALAAYSGAGAGN